MFKDWTPLYSNYKGLWVALKNDETSVIASGKKLAEVIETSSKLGYPNPIVTKTPKTHGVYIGGIIQGHKV